MPSGVVTFLMTDVEGSTGLWERESLSMQQAVARHEEIIRSCVESHDGLFLKHRGEGDSTFCVFSSPSQALVAALDIQKKLRNTQWPTSTAIKVRIGCHTGEVLLREQDYFGTTVNRCARIRALAHGGQVLFSHSLRRLAPAVAEYRIRDLGVHRLKDLQQPEHLFDLEDPDDVRAFPAPQSLTMLPNNLPIQATTFVGRKADVELLSTMVSRDRLTTIVGPGGGGKTRLALQVAAEMSQSFKGGVWFVPLGSLQRDSSATAIATSALARIDGTGDMDLVSFAKSFADSRCLLVVDNCEHLIEGAIQFVSTLISANLNVSVLATSRQSLGLSSEKIFQLQPLSLPSSDAAFEDVSGSEAVDLFRERALARNPEFRISERNYDAVRDLVRAVAGLPLAIEFVASHVRALGPRQILAKLSEFLHTSLRDVSGEERHATMENAIRWSYDGLRPTERQVFHVISAFPGGCSAAALTEVSEIGNAIPAVVALVDMSLVLRTEDPSGEPRYRLLEPFRDFVETHLGGPNAAVRTRLADWCATVAREAAANIEGERQAEWLEAVDADIDNIRLSLGWVWEHSPALLGDFVYSLRDYWTRRGFLREAVEWHKTVLASAECSEHNRALVCNSLGAFYWKQGELKLAEETFSAAAELGKSLGDPGFSARAKNNLAILLDGSGRSEEAKAAYLENLQYFQASGDLPLEATTLSNMGDLETRANRYESAIEYLEQSLEKFEEIGNQAKMARVHFNLAIVLHRSGQMGQALFHLESSFAHWARVNDPAFLGEGLNLLGIFELDFQEWEVAAFFLLASQAVLKRCAAKLEPSDAFAQQANLRLARGIITPGRFDLIRRQAGVSSPAICIERALEACRQLASKIGE